MSARQYLLVDTDLNDFRIACTVLRRAPPTVRICFVPFFETGTPHMLLI